MDEIVDTKYHVSHIYKLKKKEYRNGYEESMIDAS